MGLADFVKSDHFCLLCLPNSASSLFLYSPYLPINLLYFQLFLGIYFLENLICNTESLPLTQRVCQIAVLDNSTARQLCSLKNSLRSCTHPSDSAISPLGTVGNTIEFLPRLERYKGTHEWCAQNLNSQPSCEKRKKRKIGTNHQVWVQYWNFFPFFFLSSVLSFILSLSFLTIGNIQQ